MKDQLSKVRQRTIQYWYIDGLAEISLGFVFLILGIYFYAQATLPEGSLSYRILDVSLVLLFFVCFFLSRYFISILKNRLTYPRTGYIAYPKKQGKNRWIGYLIGAGMAALVVILVITFPGSEKLMSAITGIILAAAFLFFGLRSGILRFYLVSMIALILGSAFSFKGVGGLLGLGYFYLLIGLVLCFSGGCTLWSYYKKHPTPSEEKHE